MRIFTRRKIVLAALMIGVSSSQVAALPMMPSPAVATAEHLPIINVHSLHNNCQYDSVTPSGTGNPKAWHRTAEAGVHTNCTPSRAPGGGKLKILPKGTDSQQLQLSN